MVFNLFGIRFNLKKEVIIAGAAALLLLGCITGYLLVRDGSDIIVETHGEQSGLRPADTAAEAAAPAVPAAAAAPSADEKKIKVYVTGCVKNPGIVTLVKGQLIDDAIRLAGGATAEADLDGINLVYELKENLMLHIRSEKESEQSEKEAETPGQAGKGVKVVKDSGGAVVNENGGGDPSGGRININAASAAELDKLPGIGAATAADIIAWRESNGPFKSIEDIMKVPRIKQSRFASIKDFITVD
jgi:competence protein ComEA